MSPHVLRHAVVTNALTLAPQPLGRRFAIDRVAGWRHDESPPASVATAGVEPEHQKR
jgi:hypothetical protein